MNKHWPLAFGVLGLIFGVVIAAAANVKNSDESEAIHYHAGFQVYVDNELQDFSDLKYMKQDPCGDKHEVTESPEMEQLEKAHLHDLNGDVVHVHRDGATWGDLFQNMEYELPEGSVVTYVNGILIEGDVLRKDIGPNESVIFFFGTNTEITDKLSGAVTVGRVEEVERRSEDCGKN